ncbi:DUF4097 family beta strand repeat protein [Hyphobacterium sp. CCMP332]|nr:DUF4097 family beta strand repeat protein [Hyphobacterium sp. CCMP332]
MHYKIFCFSLFILLSCTRDKNKPYENVNIIRDEKEKKPKVKQELKIPSTFAKSSMILIELSQSDLEINSWDKDSVLINKVFPEMGNKNSEVYQGNNQIVIREKSIIKNQKGNTWKINVPKIINLTIRSENGSVSIKNVSGTFNINCTTGDIDIENSSTALQALSQSGDINLTDWELMGRSKISTSSGKLSIDAKNELAYQMSAHTGTDTLSISLNGYPLKMNLEILTFQGGGKVYCDFTTSGIEEFYSDALNKYYDLRKVQLNDSYPSSSISTGNGTIIIRR